MISQKQIAALLGISDVHLCNIISAKSDAGKKLAKKIGRTTRTPPELWTFGPASGRRAAIEELKGKR